MSTVIIGGGIIGSSVAYYLSNNQPTDEIHIIESSSQLFSAASGYAAGFIAKDWFGPSLAPLGALSFGLHHDLAARKDGAEKWGFMKGTALSLDVATESTRSGVRSDDWTHTGTSRADTASGANEPMVGNAPAWLTIQKGGVVEKISDDDTTGVVDPLRLSQYLMNTSISCGVKLHQPTKALSVVTDQSGTITGVQVVDLKTQEESTIPCTNLVISAGPWTPRVFEKLFPSSQKTFPISPIPGYSLVVRSPRYTTEHERVKNDGRSHALFTTHPDSCGFCPEIFSRQGGEIYIAGLNPTDVPFPEQAEETRKFMDKDELLRLKEVAVRLMGKLADENVASTDEVPNLDDLEVVREGLCFRPVASRGAPIISRVSDEYLGDGLKTGSGQGSEVGKARGGVFVAAGHGPWGISLSLGTGKVIAEMVEGVQTSANVSRLAI